MEETIIDLTLFPQEMAKHIQEEEELRSRGQESHRDGTVTLSICCFTIEENKLSLLFCLGLKQDFQLFLGMTILYNLTVYFMGKRPLC